MAPCDVFALNASCLQTIQLLAQTNLAAESAELTQSHWSFSIWKAQILLKGGEGGAMLFSLNCYFSSVLKRDTFSLEIIIICRSASRVLYKASWDGRM